MIQRAPARFSDFMKLMFLNLFVNNMINNMCQHVSYTQFHMCAQAARRPWPPLAPNCLSTPKPREQIYE